MGRQQTFNETCAWSIGHDDLDLHLIFETALRKIPPPQKKKPFNFRIALDVQKKKTVQSSLGESSPRFLSY